MRKLFVRAIIAAAVVLSAGAGLIAWRIARQREMHENEHLKQGDAMLGKSKPKDAVAAYLKALATPAHDAALFRLAALYETAGDFRKAEQYLLEARKKAPRDLELQLSLARVIAATGRVREGYLEAKKAADIAPDDGQVLALLAALATTKDEAQHASDRLRSWNNAHGKKPSESQQPATETLVPLAAAYARIGEQEKAERTWGEAKRVGVRDLNFALNLANVYFSMERLEPAEKILIAATESDAKRAATWLRLAAVEAGLHHWAAAGDALAHLDKTLKAHPDTVLIAARVQLGLQKPKEAKRMLQELIAGALEHGSQRQRSRAYFWLAQTELALDETKQAQEHLEASIAADADFVTPELALADIYLAQGTPELAVARLAAVAERKPEAHQVFRLLGQARLDTNDAKGAEAAYKHYRELLPDDPEGPFLEATALEAQGRIAEAEKRLETSLALDPSAFGPLRRLVVLLANAKRFEEAENRVHIELARKGRRAHLLTLLGDLALAQRAADPTKTAEAEKAYREAVSLDPATTAAWLALGRLYVEAGENDRAILMFGEAIKHDADLPEAWMQIAQLYVARGDATKAEAALREVVTRHPTFPPALNNLAYVYSELLDKPDRALELAERAARAAPRSPSVADTYGWALFRAGKVDRAVQVLRASTKDLPNSAGAHYHLGMALLESGQREEGRAALTRALGLSASFPGAQAARAALAK